MGGLRAGMWWSGASRDSITVMGTFIRMRCPACGADRRPTNFGLTPSGAFDSSTAYPNELCLRIDTIGGRGRLCVERTAAPVALALGMREMLRFRLAQVEAELRAAGVELPD